MIVYGLHMENIMAGISSVVYNENFKNILWVVSFSSNHGYHSYTAFAPALYDNE